RAGRPHRARPRLERAGPGAATQPPIRGGPRARSAAARKVTAVSCGLHFPRKRSGLTETAAHPNGQIGGKRQRCVPCARVQAVTIADGNIEVTERPDPEPGKGEILVSVGAAGLNGADMIQRKGHYPAPPGSPSDIPGLEPAGVVV